VGWYGRDWPVEHGGALSTAQRLYFENAAPNAMASAADVRSGVRPSPA